MPLAGTVIAVPETRELGIFADLLERRGANVLRCPLVGIRDAPDPAPVLAWARRLTAGDFDTVVLQTGEGLSRLLSCIEKHAPELSGLFVHALRQTRTIARGPKPGRVLRSLGLRSDLVASPATTEGLVTLLSSLDLSGQTVGVQLYGAIDNPPLLDALRAAGASTETVSPYVYTDASADDDVQSLIDRLAEGAIDAIAFTSMGQVRRLFEVAERSGRELAVRAGLQRTHVACVGPLVAGALAELGIATDSMPGEAWFLKPLTQALSDHFTPRD